MQRFTFSASVGLVIVAFAIAGCGGSAATTAPAAVSSSTPSGHRLPPTQGAPRLAARRRSRIAGGRRQRLVRRKMASGTPSTSVTCSPWPRWPLSPASRSASPRRTTRRDTRSTRAPTAARTAPRASTVSVLALDAAAGFDSAMKADPNAKVINGLGDKAFSSILGVFALFGNVQITVSNLQSDAAAVTLDQDPRAQALTTGPSGLKAPARRKVG